MLRACRQRRITGPAERRLCETMLSRGRDQGLLTAPGRQRTDSTPGLAAVQPLNRLECVGETLRPALHGRATAAPDGLRSWGPAVWLGRDRQRWADARLPPEPSAREALAEHIGTDGRP